MLRAELADIYPMGNFVFNIIGQDVSDLGGKFPPINQSSGKLARYVLPETALQVGRNQLIAMLSAGPDQASADKALMGYFVSDAVQQALPFWTLMPLPPVLADAAMQAVDSMIIRPLNTSRGGASAAATSSTGGDSPHTKPGFPATAHLNPALLDTDPHASIIE